MKKYLLPLWLVSMAAVAQAADYDVAAGRDFQQFSRTPQGVLPGFSLDYIHHDNHGSAGGAGLEMGGEFGALTLAAGAKAMALDTDSGSGGAALLGARANLALGHGVSLFASAFQAPGAWSSGSISKVVDQAAGLRWQPLRPLTLNVGYRRFEIDRQDDSRSRKLADGAYVGAGLSF
jgi:hypothetical protein